MTADGSIKSKNNTIFYNSTKIIKYEKGVFCCEQGNCAMWQDLGGICYIRIVGPKSDLMIIN